MAFSARIGSSQMLPRSLAVVRKPRWSPTQLTEKAVGAFRGRGFSGSSWLGQESEAVEQQEAEEAVPKPSAGYEEQQVAGAGEDRDFYLNILSSTSSKREARSYVQRFTPSYMTGSTGSTFMQPIPRFTSPISRDQLYVQSLLQKSSPVSPAAYLLPHETAGEELHVALVKIREVESIDDKTLRGIGRTLSQLRRLGLLGIVVVDSHPPQTVAVDNSSFRHAAESAADRIVSAIEYSRGTARRVDGSVSCDSTTGVEISLPSLLIAPLARGIIPVLAPIAHDDASRIVPASANELVRALTRSLSMHSPGEHVEQTVSLDRIIFLDPLGGIPSEERKEGAHVFVNLQQEYPTIRKNLSSHREKKQHLANLDTLRDALALLPPSSSGIITTPQEASSSAPKSQPEVSAPKGRNKNPLIHNLLTDKPIISSSLPVRSDSPIVHTTLLKHGIPLLFHPSGTKLSGPKINLPKLVALIEDSFGRKLDVDRYLKRVDENIAGVVVAGDYEGAALVTWEGDRVAYLDKFAVARRSQGAGGVADVVFKSMLEGVRKRWFREIEGIVWRSRGNNPVNKWYFERAKGTWDIPDSKWTMFWTTNDADVCQRRFLEYVDICKNTQPSFKF